MLVTERMRSLGEHAKSSRQPPLKERRHAKASESAAKTVDIDEDILDTGAARESATAVIVDNAAPKTVTHVNGAIAEITPDEEAAVLATVAAVLAKIEPQSVTADESATSAETSQEDAGISAAKRAIIHEWENWSALHSDELDDPNVAEYFFQHLQQRRLHLLNFMSKNEDASKAVQGWVSQRTKLAEQSNTPWS
jgi:hypothetical protein